ncbi:MAG: radical SAM protein [Prevotella sp.]|nr:radical SAM protein [Prevotella sp.]
MKRINEIFYSLQGEGRNTGRAAIFIRFAGCNLRCSFCDTEFDSYQEMSDEDILQAIAPYPARFVVLTGGEPTLQADEAFVELLHSKGYEVAMESNGTRPAPKNLDWLTVSPKQNRKGEMGDEKWTRQPDEIKIVFEEDTNPETIISHFPLPHFLYLQPCDTGDPQRNADIMKRCVEYILQHPKWQLSLQTHKLINIQ